MPNWSIGRTGQLYLAEEATYATAPTLLATNAFRHLSAKLTFNPRQPAKSPERHTHPSQTALYNRRQAASFEVKAQWYPSGTLNTLPECDLVLKNSLGTAAKNTTLATTFSGTPTTTGGTIASGTGLAIGDPVVITIASGGNAGTYLRWLTAAGTTPTWTPALPGAPAAGDSLKGCASYVPATAIPKSLDIAHYPQAPSASTPSREMLGNVIDKLTIEIDGNVEPVITLSGPAQGFAGSSPSFTAQSQPGGFTTIGAESVVGGIALNGYFYFNGTLYQIEKLKIEIVNTMELQNTALGTNKAQAFFRKGKREVMVSIDAKVSDDTTVWAPALATSSNPLMLQLGTTVGKMWGIYCPYITLTTVPDIPDGDETNNWSFQGQALGSAGNDEIFIAAA